MDTLGSQNGEWKFGKMPIYSYRAHIATSFVLVAIVSGRAVSEEICRFGEDKAVD
jgi:hypothetical protein